MIEFVNECIENFRKKHPKIYNVLYVFYDTIKHYLQSLLIFWGVFEALKNFIKWLVEFFELKLLGQFVVSVSSFIKSIIGPNISLVFALSIAVALVYSLVMFFKKRSITIHLSGCNKKIDIKFGDIFSCEGIRIIGVNNFFDTLVDGYIVSKNSLHGQLIKKMNDNGKKIDEAVKKIQNVVPERIMRAKGKQNKFPIGTTVSVSNGNDEYLLVALSDTDNEDYKARATIDDIMLSTRKALTKADAIAQARGIFFPLWGTKLSRSGLNHAQALCAMLIALEQEIRKTEIAGKISIVVYTNDFDKVDLLALKKMWRREHGVS